MIEHARTAVRMFLVIPALLAAVSLVGAAVQAAELAGSFVNAVIAFTLLPLVCWLGWRAAITSARASRWLTRGTLMLTAGSVLLALLGAGWPALVAIATGTPAAEVAHEPVLFELAGLGLCCAGLLFGIIAAAVLWADPGAHSGSAVDSSPDAT